MAENLIVNLPFLSPRSILRSGFTGSLRFSPPYVRLPTTTNRFFKFGHPPYEKIYLSTAATCSQREADTINTMLYIPAGINIQIAVLTSKRVRSGGGGPVEAEPDFCRDRFRLIPHLFPLFDICKWLLNKCFTVRVNAIWNSLHAAGYVGDVTLKRCRPTARPGLGDIKLA